MSAKFRVALYGAPNGFLKQVQAMFPNDPIEDDELQFVEQPTPGNHTHVIAFTNEPIDSAISGHVPKENCIGISLEPILFLNAGPKSIERIQKTLRVLVLGAAHCCIANSVAGYCLIPSDVFLSVPAVPKPFSQRLCVSLPLSMKRITPLQIYRQTLATALLNDSRNLPVHIWGRGAFHVRRNLPNDSRIRGGFRGPEPYKDYAFCVAIENRQEGMYFSEKVSLPIYYGCTPLYMGTLQINTFFPGGVIPLTGNVGKDVDIIARAAHGHLPPCNTEAAKKYFQEHWHWGRAIKSFLATDTTEYDQPFPAFQDG